MIIDFTVENYRSIHEPVTLNFLPEGVTTEQLSETVRPLKVIGIFGEPRTGKTTLLRSLDHLLTIMRDTYDDKEDIFTQFQPADESKHGQKILTRFAIRITIGPWIYAYHLAADRLRIRHERLSISLLEKADLATLPKRVAGDEKLITNLTRQPGPLTFFDHSWNDETQTYRGTYEPGFEPEEDVQPTASHLTYVLTLLDSSPLRDFNTWLDSCPTLDKFADNRYLGPIYSRRMYDFRASAPIFFEYLCLSAVDDPAHSAHHAFLPELGLDETYEMLLVDPDQAPYPCDAAWEEAFQKFKLTHDLLASWILGPPIIFDDLDTRFSDRLAISIARLFHDPAVNWRNGQLIFSSTSERFASLLSADEARRLIKPASEAAAIIPFSGSTPDNQSQWPDVQPHDVDTQQITRTIAERTLQYSYYSHEPIIAISAEEFKDEILLFEERLRQQKKKEDAEKNSSRT